MGNQKNGIVTKTGDLRRINTKDTSTYFCLPILAANARKCRGVFMHVCAYYKIFLNLCLPTLHWEYLSDIDGLKYFFLFVDVVIPHTIEGICLRSKREIWISDSLKLFFTTCNPNSYSIGGL